MSAYNFGRSGRNLTKLYQVTCLEASVIKWTLILQGVPPTKFGRAKNVRNSARFLKTFDFDPEYLRKGSTYRKSEKYLINYISSPIRRKKFGELLSTNQNVIDAHVDPQKWTFSGDDISASRQCWTLKFLHTLQSPKMYLKWDVGRRAAACWALPHISSYFFIF